MSPRKPPLSSESMLELGEAIDRSDLPRAMNVLAHASGSLVAPLPTDDELEDDQQQLAPGAPRRRRRKKKAPLLDASGYPTIASLDTAELRALCQAAWARCHGKAVRQTGFVRAYRRLHARELVEKAPRSMSGDEVTWYAATSLGALVILKALLVGNRRVVSAAAELR